MARIALVPADDMTDEQRRVHDKILGQRGIPVLRGPFAVMLHAPEICEKVSDFVDHFMSETRISGPLTELAIITVARQYTAQYEWFIHAKRALELGLDEAVVEAIRTDRRPEFSDPEQQLVYDMVNEIAEERKLSDDHYNRAVAAFGAAAVVELITLIGFYHAISVLLNSYQVEIPDIPGPAPMTE